MIESGFGAGRVGLFFVANGKLLAYTCTLAEGERYGDFINHPESHDGLWRRLYCAQYGVDYDWFSRGRIVYNRAADTYLLYHDACIVDAAAALSRLYAMLLDEHYQCQRCNQHYVI